MFSYWQSCAGRATGTRAEVTEHVGAVWPSGRAGSVWWVADPSKKQKQARPAEVVEAAAWRALSRDVNYAAKVSRVRRHQARLRSQLSARAWQAYLRLEEAEIERWSYALERVARWAASSRRRAQPR